MSKGRSKELIQKRDEALLRRYHFWTEVQRLRFDDALKQLSENEFFISEERIMSIIRENYKKIPDLIINPVPKVKKPRITSAQLELFINPEPPTSR
ncbi:transposase [Bacteroidales bacterium OttesenSCG-928-J19]|nr:transposase [Bacteroidales bacterium OttesenSCG-928-J19]